MSATKKLPDESPNPRPEALDRIPEDVRLAMVKSLLDRDQTPLTSQTEADEEERLENKWARDRFAQRSRKT